MQSCKMREDSTRWHGPSSTEADCLFAPTFRTREPGEEAVLTGVQAKQSQGGQVIRVVAISCSAVSSDGSFCIVLGTLTPFVLLCPFKCTIFLI